MMNLHTYCSSKTHFWHIRIKRRIKADVTYPLMDQMRRHIEVLPYIFRFHSIVLCSIWEFHINQQTACHQVLRRGFNVLNRKSTSTFQHEQTHDHIAWLPRCVLLPFISLIVWEAKLMYSFSINKWQINQVKVARCLVFYEDSLVYTARAQTAPCDFFSSALSPGPQHCDKIMMLEKLCRTTCSCALLL